MALTRLDDTRRIKGIKAKGTVLADLTAFLPHMDEGDLFLIVATAVAGGGLYCKNDGAAYKICEIGASAIA